MYGLLNLEKIQIEDVELTFVIHFKEFNKL
jgi:hypothetical protein